MSAPIEQTFKKATHYIKHAPQKNASNETKLSYYKFFKQATVGDVQGAQPWAVQVEARAKWDAWNSVKGMSKPDAMSNYVDLLTKDTPTWESHECLNNF